jgi:hypothetical protein
MATEDEWKVFLDGAAPVVRFMDCNGLARLIRDMADDEPEPQRSATMYRLAERYADQIWKEIRSGTHQRRRQQPTTHARRVTS